MSRSDLEARVLAWMREGALAARDDARFSELALALFAHQLEHCAPYARICAAQGVRGPLSDWREIPAVPTGAFKEARLACFSEDRTQRVFRTSGTTTEARGELHLDTLEPYETSLLETFRAFVCPDLAPGQRMRFVVLAPSDITAADSSLSYMFGAAVRTLGDARSRFWLEPRSATGADARRAAPLANVGALATPAGAVPSAATPAAATPAWDPDACIAELAACREPIVLAGTAFAFVHLLDRMAETRAHIALPGQSRILETGGFKGRSRELSRDELHGQLTARLGVPPTHLLNQYGMCELGSQFYEPSLREGVATEWKVIPPWVRTRALDPETLRDVPEGEVGLLAHYDLANTGSVLAVLTSDLGCVQGARLHLRGRLAGAEARGCSRAADALLGGV